MNLDDIDAIIEGVAPVVVEFVAKEVDARVKALPVPKDGEQGPPGKDGETPVIDYPAIHERLATDMAEAIKQLPPAERGEKGEPGKDAEPIDFDALAAAAAMHVPTPKDGADGKDGEPGEKGDPGKDAVVDVSAIVAEVTMAVETKMLVRAEQFFSKAADTFIKGLEWTP